jgi:hypothetical protein
VLYTLKGTQSSADSKVKVHRTYLEIPALAKYKLDNQLYFFGGSYVGFMLSAEITDGDVSVDVKDLFNNTDAGLKIGLGFETTSNLSFSVQYALGPVNVNGDELEGCNNNKVTVSPWCTGSARNSNFLFCAAHFSLPGKWSAQHLSDYFYKQKTKSHLS